MTDLSVTPETVLNTGKSLLVLGEGKAIKKCFQFRITKLFTSDLRLTFLLVI